MGVLLEDFKFLVVSISFLYPIFWSSETVIPAYYDTMNISSLNFNHVAHSKMDLKID